jgi:hypothetical protein
VVEAESFIRELEIAVVNQPKRNRTLVHFVNLSWHSDTAYFMAISWLDNSSCKE